MLPRILGALATASVAGVLVAPVAAGLPAGGPAASSAVAPSGMPAGSLADWQKGQWWIDNAKLHSWHDQGITGKGVTIALLDGPIFTGIPELQGQDVKPVASLCENDRAKILAQDWGPTTPDGPLNDTSFHTTSIGALLVGNGKGNGPNGVGVQGVAPGAALRTYALFNTKNPDAGQNLDCWSPGMADFINKVVDDGVNIIEIPVGIDVRLPAVEAAFNRAINRGIIVVTGAGNGGPATPVMSPGNNFGVLVVGGMQADGKVLETNPTSQADDWQQAQTIDVARNIHVVAPGKDLLGGGLAPGNRWDSAVLQSGTSGASAIVAAQLALMKQKWPKATSNQLLYSLLRTARRPEGSAVWEPRRGFGTTSFTSTLTTDPSVYPDVMPIYRTMANVFTDHPVPPFIPEQVGADGMLPSAPPSANATASTGTPTPASSSAPSAAPATPTPVAASATETSGGTGVMWLVVAVVAAIGLLAGGWALARNRRPTVSAAATQGAPTAPEPHKDTPVHAAAAGSAARPPADSPDRARQGGDTP